MRRFIVGLVVAAVAGTTFVVVPAAAVVVPVAPGAPSGVSASALVGGVAVSWSAPASDGGSALTGFVVTPSVGDPVRVGPEITDAVVEAPAGTPVSVTVAAVNAVGSSVPSAVAGPVTPSAPGGLVRAIAPKRLVDSRYGTGVTKGKFGVNAERVVQVTGKAGVPSSGVAAVFVNVMALDVDASTSLRVYPDGSSVPGTSSLEARKAERVIQMVQVRVGTGGRIRVRNGVGSTNVVLDVVGYTLTPTASGASTNGLVTTTTPTEVLNTRTGVGTPRAKLGEKRFVDATVLGKGGVPATGVAAVFVNVTAYGPSRITGITVYPAGPLPGTQNLSAVPGVNRTNRVLVPVAAGGKVRIYNQFGTVDVKLDLAGWVADGSDASLGADSLNPQAPARLADTRTGTGTPKAQVAKGAEITITAAGAAGVPKTTATTPAVAVLAFVRIFTTTATSSVSLRPAGTPWVSVADVTGRGGQTMGNLVLVPLSADGKITLRSSPGSSGPIDVAVDIVGWIGGSVLVNADTRILDTATAAAITTVTDTTVTVGTATGTAASLKVGDIISTGPTAKAPNGLLRRITSITSGTGKVTFGTTPVGLRDAVRRGGFSAGSVSPDAPPPPAAANRSGPQRLGGSTGIELSYEKPFDETLAESGDATVTLEGELSMNASAGIAVDIGLGGPRADFDVAASERFDATLTAEYAGSWSTAIDLGEVSFGTKTALIGYVPVVFEPALRLAVEASAAVDGTATVGITQSIGASAGVTITEDGAETRNDFTNNPPAIIGPTATAQATARITAIPELVVTFYGTAEAGLQVRPYLELTSDGCTIDLNAGIDLGIRAQLEFIGPDLPPFGPETTNIYSAELATIDLGTCADVNQWRGWVAYQRDDFFPEGGRYVSRNLLTDTSATSTAFTSSGDNHNYTVNFDPFTGGCTNRLEWGGETTGAGTLRVGSREIPEPGTFAWDLPAGTSVIEFAVDEGDEGFGGPWPGVQDECGGLVESFLGPDNGGGLQAVAPGSAASPPLNLNATSTLSQADTFKVTSVVCMTRDPGTPTPVAQLPRSRTITPRIPGGPTGYEGLPVCTLPT